MINLEVFMQSSCRNTPEPGAIVHPATLGTPHVSPGPQSYGWLDDEALCALTTGSVREGELSVVSPGLRRFDIEWLETRGLWLKHLQEAFPLERVVELHELSVDLLVTPFNSTFESIEPHVAVELLPCVTAK